MDRLSRGICRSQGSVSSFLSFLSREETAKRSGTIQISSTEPVYNYRLIRLVQGHSGPHAPPVRIEQLPGSPQGTVLDGKYQAAHPGSYADVEALGITDEDKELVVSLYVQPYLLDCGRPSVIVSSLDVDSKSGVAILVGTDGIVEFWIGTGAEIKKVGSRYKLSQWRWHYIWFRVAKNGDFLAMIEQRNRLVEKATPLREVNGEVPAASLHGGSRPLTMAAGFFSSSECSEEHPTLFFNGRLDSPKFEATSGATGLRRVLASYDFSTGIPTETIYDVSGAGRHGKVYNAPTRGVKGYDWDGSEPDWTKAKYGYGAIHFHEDDLDDASWETSFTLTVPNKARSGAYAVQISTPDGRVGDNVTFFVRPSKATSEMVGAKVALILSTFTYLAYANEHMYDDTKDSKMEVAGGLDILKDDNFLKMQRRVDLGLAMYDVHRDGSGTVFSSAKRPILNVRPGYVHWATHRPREFSSDLLTIGFLERSGIPYDVCYDHDLHLHGLEAIRRYHTVVTGCHPEYPSLESLDAYSSFAKAGGNIAYLGGNGFYWTSVTDKARPHLLEVRRGDQGCRSFSLEPGERIHSLNGKQGGLWRSRGRPPNVLFAVGSDAFGTGPGVPFRRTPEGHDERFSWVFEGLRPDELIGEYGFGGGASGDEIDRLDFSLGSPYNTVLLATSTGHNDSFALFNEECMFPMVNTLGTQTDKIRSDMTLYETSARGLVFSVGSINWACSLGWDSYDNSVAKVTGNVLKEFHRRATNRQ